MNHILSEKAPVRRFLVSNDYIYGLVEGEGCFTLCTHKNNYSVFKVPTFCIQMHIRDRELIKTICNRLHLPNEIYEYQPSNKDGWNRGKTVRLVVREFESLKTKIIPFFYKKLHGNKGIQFEEWINKIGFDSLVSPKFRTLYELYQSGYYENFHGDTFWKKYDTISEI